MTSLTDFQWQVLGATLKIPLGETRSYAWIAREIGRPGAVRAVGQALKKNPFPLMIPCHRVIKADGTPGGYAGRDRQHKKTRLLNIEKDIRKHLSGHRNTNRRIRPGRS